MDGKGHAAWDEHQTRTLSLRPRRRTTDDTRAAAEHRTAFLANPDPAQLTAELQRRRAALRPSPFFSRTTRPLYTIILILLAAIALVSLFRSVGTSFPIFAAAMPATAAAGLLRDHGYRHHILQIDRARSGCCPDCGYDLHGVEVPPPFHTLDTGPTLCPECGSLWPLVPPAVPSQ